MVCGKPLYFSKSTVVPLHFHCLSTVCICSVLEKSCRGHHHSEILKTNTKTLIYSIWIWPQGSLGCQKVRQGPLNTLFEVWCANIAPKMKKIQNTLRKQGFFTFFFFQF